MEPYSLKLNLKEICVNWIGMQNWELSQKATLAFYLVSKGKNSLVSVNHIVEICSWLEFISKTNLKKNVIHCLLKDAKKLTKEQFIHFIDQHERKVFYQLN